MTGGPVTTYKAFSAHAGKCDECERVRLSIVGGWSKTAPMAGIFSGWWQRACPEGKELLQQWNDACQEHEERRRAAEARASAFGERRSA